MQIALGGRACGPPPVSHSFTNNSQSAISCALRIRADAGISFGARGSVSSFRPASCGRRLPFFVFTSLLDQTRFSHASLPPRERGTTWSRLPSSGFCEAPRGVPFCISADRERGKPTSAECVLLFDRGLAGHKLD